MKKLLFLLCFIISIHAFGQHTWTEGTLHLNNGIVKKGLIIFPQVSKDLILFPKKQRVLFKANKKAKKEKYDHKNVEKVVFINADKEAEEYIYIPVSKKRHELFKKIVEGKATLYSRIVAYTEGSSGEQELSFTDDFVMTDLNDYGEFYVLREGEKIASPLITLRLSRSFKKRAMEYFSDCPEIVAKLKDKTFRQEDIKEVVTMYNQCN
ncbi:MAG: hypothetical protein AAF611_03340 [Bacteroidota bacterium]